jgi:dTDP-4-amino-4,6-dideoxygalactose transaminase
MVLTELRSRGVMAQVNYIPAYFHPVFKKQGYKKGNCPNSELFYNQEISIPLHTLMTEQLIAEICYSLECSFG